MSEEIENKLNKIPVVKQLVSLTKAVKLKSLEGLSLYDILELYVLGIFKGPYQSWFHFLLIGKIDCAVSMFLV